MSNAELRRMLERQRPPGPADELERRVLGAARVAIRTERPVSLSDRLWFDRGLRYGWVATVILLVAIQVVVVGSSERRLRGLAAAPAASIETPAAAVTRELGLSPRGSMARPVARRPARPTELSGVPD